MTPALRAAVLLRHGAACAACGEASARLEIDHIKPVERGGGDDLDNLRPLCPACHARKTAAENKSRAKARHWLDHVVAMATGTKRKNAKERAKARAATNLERNFTVVSKRVE